MKKVDLLLINPPFHRREGGGAIFPLGLGYILAEVESAGFSWEVIDCTTIISSFYEEDLCLLKKKLEKKLMEYEPKAVGIGPCITSQLRALIMIGELCIKHFGEENVYAGGPLASIPGQEWIFFELLGIKNIMKGDGEYATVEMLKLLYQGKKICECPGISQESKLITNEITNLDNLLFPLRYNLHNNTISMRRAINDSMSSTISMITSRGCMYQCTYCVSGNIKYKKFRKRSYENIIQEIKELKKKIEFNDIIFYDDCFFYNKNTASQDVSIFCNLLLNYNLNISWQMEIRMDLLVCLKKEDILLLEQSGCRLINVGIEKTTEAGLKYLGKSESIKGVTEKIKEIKELTKIKVAGTFILGGENESISDVKKLIYDSKKMHLDYAHYNPLFVYPGTPIYEQQFDNEKEWAYYILNDDLPWGEIVYENDKISRSELIELVEEAYQSFYEGTEYVKSNMVKNRFNLKRERQE